MRETEEIEERNGGESRLAGTACAVADTRHAAPRDHKVTPPAGRTRFRADVEGLRAIALLVVLLYHAEVAWLPGGYVGVDIFFVISGFLITALLMREWDATGNVRTSEFYRRRVVRLLPGLVAFLPLVLIWAAWRGSCEWPGSTPSTTTACATPRSRSWPWKRNAWC